MLTLDKWHVTCDTQYKKDESVNLWVNEKGAFKTAIARTGLLKSLFMKIMRIFCTGPTYRIGQEIQCLPYEGFKKKIVARLKKKVLKKYLKNFRSFCYFQLWDITDISTRECERCWFSDMFRLFLIPTYNGKFL